MRISWSFLLVIALKCVISWLVRAIYSVMYSYCVLFPIFLAIFRYEAKFIEEITKVVGNKLRSLVSDFAPDLVGLHSRVENNQLWLEEDGPTDYGLVPICGMGGFGKSTLHIFCII